MTEVRFLKKEELAGAIRLADSTFIKPGEKSMAERFPPAFSGAARQSAGVFEEGKLVSFIGVVPRIVNIGPARLHVMSIGAVCTHPDYRGRGHAGRILRFIQAHAREADVSLLLVSGDGPLYARAGCRPFGGIHRLEAHRADLPSLLADSEGDIQFREMREKDLFQVHALCCAREVTFEQSLWDWSTLIEAGGFASNKNLEQQVWVAERDGRIIAFAVAAVPAKAKPKCEPLIIEWAGNKRAVASLIAHVMARHELDVMFWPLPAHEGNLEGVAMRSSEDKQPCTVCIVDANRFLEQAAPYLKAQHPNCPDVEQWSVRDGAIRLRTEDGSTQMTAEEFHSVAFNPVAWWPEHLQSQAALAALFPVPFPYTGGLHYL